eukprot:2211622-Rhodomonas_salina.3
MRQSMILLFLVHVALLLLPRSCSDIALRLPLRETTSHAQNMQSMLCVGARAGCKFSVISCEKVLRLRLRGGASADDTLTEEMARNEGSFLGWVPLPPLPPPPHHPRFPRLIYFPTHQRHQELCLPWDGKCSENGGGNRLHARGKRRFLRGLMKGMTKTELKSRRTRRQKQK